MAAASQAVTLSTRTAPWAAPARAPVPRARSAPRPVRCVSSVCHQDGRRSRCAAIRAVHSGSAGSAPAGGDVRHLVVRPPAATRPRPTCPNRSRRAPAPARAAPRAAGPAAGPVAGPAAGAAGLAARGRHGEMSPSRAGVAPQIAQRRASSRRTGPGARPNPASTSVPLGHQPLGAQQPELSRVPAQVEHDGVVPRRALPAPPAWLQPATASRPARSRPSLRPAPEPDTPRSPPQPRRPADPRAPQPAPQPRPAAPAPSPRPPVTPPAAPPAQLDAPRPPAPRTAPESARRPRPPARGTPAPGAQATPEPAGPHPIFTGEDRYLYRDICRVTNVPVSCLNGARPAPLQTQADKRMTRRICADRRSRPGRCRPAQRG